jgi:hypothetical protein
MTMMFVVVVVVGIVGVREAWTTKKKSNLRRRFDNVPFEVPEDVVPASSLARITGIAVIGRSIGRTNDVVANSVERV